MASTAPASPEPVIDELEPVADETAFQARRIVATHATDAEECRMLLDMLGVGPEPVDPAEDE